MLLIFWEQGSVCVLICRHLASNTQLIKAGFTVSLGLKGLSNMTGQHMVYQHLSAKPFYSENLSHYSLRFLKSVCLCLVNKSQILIHFTTPLPLILEDKKCGLTRSDHKAVVCSHEQAQTRQPFISVLVWSTRSVTGKIIF